MDFSSTDGLDKWIVNNLTAYLESGKLKFYRIPGYSNFIRSFSRNVCINLSKGTHICNLDADNYAGPGFDSKLISTFKENNARLVTVTGSKDTMGKFAMPRKSFENVRGFDERIESYGFEDHDLQRRLLNTGLIQYCISDTKYNKYIAHDDELRLGNEKLKKELQTIFIHPLSSFKVNFIFLYRNGKSLCVTMEDTFNLNTHKYAICNNYATTNIYETPYRVSYQNNTSYEFNDSTCKVLIDEESSVRIETISDMDKINEIVKMLTENENRKYMMKNSSDNIIVNPEGYGKATNVLRIM